MGTNFFIRDILIQYCSRTGSLFVRKGIRPYCFWAFPPSFPLPSPTGANLHRTDPRQAPPRLALRAIPSSLEQPPQCRPACEKGHMSANGLSPQLFSQRESAHQQRPSGYSSVACPSFVAAVTIYRAKCHGISCQVTRYIVPIAANRLQPVDGGPKAAPKTARTPWPPRCLFGRFIAKRRNNFTEKARM